MSTVRADNFRTFDGVGKAPFTVNTIAELRTLAVVEGMKVKPVGYYAAGDGGGGPIRVAKTGAAAGTYVDNGGSIIVPTGGDGSTAWLMEHAGTYNVKWFGAKGDGTADDTAPIQATVDTLNLSGGSIYFPKGEYRVTDTIHFGFWSIESATGNVQGFAEAKNGIKVTGDSRQNSAEIDAVLKWDGPLQLGNNVVTLSDSVGTYTYIDNDAPVVSVLGGFGLHFEGVSIDGNHKAFAGVRFNGNIGNYSFTEASVRNCRVGIQLTVGLRHDTYAQYYGRADSPYYKANIYDAPSVGGFASDTCRLQNLFVANCQDGISVESQQALFVNIDNVWIASTAANMPNWSPFAGIVNSGGRLNLRGVGVGLDLEYGIWHVSKNSFITVQEFHDESNASFSFKTAANPSALSEYIGYNGNMLGIEVTAGAADISLHGVRLNGQIKRTNDNSSTHNFILNMSMVRSTYAGEVIDLGTVANKNNIQVGVRDILLTGAGAVITNDWGLFLGTIENISPTPIYNKYSGFPDKNQWLIEEGNANQVNDGYALHFSGGKTGIPDETVTRIMRFRTEAAMALRVVMDVIVQTGPSTVTAARAQQIAFTYMRDTDGAITVSPVSVLHDQEILSGFASITTTYSVAVVGDYIELSVNQNNETPDVTGNCTYTGKIFGGYTGGFTTNNLLEFD